MALAMTAEKMWPGISAGEQSRCRCSKPAAFCPSLVWACAALGWAGRKGAEQGEVFQTNNLGRIRDRLKTEGGVGVGTTLPSRPRSDGFQDYPGAVTEGQRHGRSVLNRIMAEGQMQFQPNVAVAETVHIRP